MEKKQNPSSASSESMAELEYLPSSTKGVFVSAEQITQEVLDQFMRLRMVGLKRSYRHATAERVGRFVRFCKSRPTQNLLEIYAEYASHMHETLAPSTYARNIAAVNNFLSWCREMEYITKTPQMLVRTAPARIRAPRRPIITPEKYQRLLDAIERGSFRDKATLRDLFLTGWWTGMSSADACSIQWGNIDIDNMMIQLPRVKNQQMCYVPIIAGSEFHKYILKRREDDPLSPDWPNNPEEGIYFLNPFLAAWRIVACQRDGTAGAIVKACSKVFKEAGLRGNSFHDFRRSMATLLGNSPGVSTGQALQIMGWKNADMLVHYMQPDAAGLQNAFQQAIARRHEQKTQGGRDDWWVQVPPIHPIEYPKDQVDPEQGDADTGIGRPLDPDERE